MKKYLIAVLLLFIPCVTYALTMCARDNSLVISLNNNVKGTGSFNESEFTWRVDFDYGTVLGEATCLSKNETNKYTDAENKISQDVPKAFKGNDDQGNVRVNCYCRITHPAVSRWVYKNDLGVACGANCTKTCVVNGMESASGYRGQVFNTIGK